MMVFHDLNAPVARRYFDSPMICSWDKDGFSARALYQLLVHRGVHEPGVGVPMHEGVYLQLRLVEGVLGGGHHVRVDDLAHPRVQRHLSGGKNRNVVLIYHSRLLLYFLRISLLL